MTTVIGNDSKNITWPLIGNDSKKNNMTTVIGNDSKNMT